MVQAPVSFNVHCAVRLNFGEEDAQLKPALCHRINQFLAGNCETDQPFQVDQEQQEVGNAEECHKDLHEKTNTLLHRY